MRTAHTGVDNKTVFRFMIIPFQIDLFSGPVSVETLAPVNGFHMSVLEQNVQLRSAVMRVTGMSLVITVGHCHSGGIGAGSVGGCLLYTSDAADE